MLKKEAVDKLKLLGFDTDKLIAAIKSDKEEDFDTPNGTILTDDELTQRDSNKVAEGKKEGAKEERKALIKEVSNRLGITTNRERIGDLVNDIQTKVNGTEDEKIKELNDRVTLLQKDKELLEQDRDAYKGQVAQVQADYDIMGDFPDGRQSILNDREYLSIAKSALEFKADGVYKDGQIIRDSKSQAPLSRKEVLKTFFEERKFIGDGAAPAGGGGRGGGNTPPAGGGTGGIKTLTQAQESWRALDPVNNTNVVSSEFDDYLSGIASKDPNFDYTK